MSDHVTQSIHHESKEEVHDAEKHPVHGGPEIAIEICAGGFREVSKAKEVDIINDNENMTAISKRLRRERHSYRSFPMFNLSRKRQGGVLALKNDEAMRHGGVLSFQNDSSLGHITGSVHRSESHLPSKSSEAPPEMDTLEFRFQPGGISQSSEQQVKSHKDLETNSLAVSTSLQDDFMRSSLKIVPHGINSGLSGQDDINQSNSIMASEKLVQDTNHHNHSTILVHEKKFSNLLDSITSGKSFLRQKAYHVGKQSSPPETAQTEKLYHECYSLARLPYSVDDVEAMRTYTTNDSMRGAARSPFKFSQTTHHIMITEKTDVDLSDKRQIPRESTVSAKLQRKTLSEILSLSPDFRFHIQKGVKLQPLESSTESEGKENVRDVNVPDGLKNESSAETDTMDMDVLQENYLPGGPSSSSRKFLKGKSQTSQAADASARVEMEGRPLNGVVCDLNHPVPDLSALASPMGCSETSSSRTQSLDIEQLLSDAEQPETSKPSGCQDDLVGLEPETSKPSGCQDDLLGPEPSSRWAKRLKLSSPGSAHGIKSSKMGEAPTHEEGNKFFSQILKCGITSSEPSLGRCHGKEQMELGQNAKLIRNGESSSVDSGKKSQYVTLSHPWIRRWCHNRVASPQKRPEAVVVCEPQCSKATLDGFQKKQFPSIAAMALMGKAMCGFPPCEYTKRGPFVVWNTKGS
ncbi:uncharacterized protein LOC122312464 [Carya illinoinensis]|uniref:F-box protein n=1 Tax=Carya illinoinensis TaxID=32201 RepID=A0A8T1QBF9_CARIL|nr:uncharacterized protein LOC122312464 [Carya illinoinensis]XP_042983009.1 uncharacterized protein LOC122312464 [Carya illinoinensis]KAG6651748.1 hypothetical protein CIPAW_06G134300 [Carya illinoinensis]KAG6651749.1 hypothetical protein CIPAW_06G134300 [Carya illinoinensis]